MNLHRKAIYAKIGLSLIGLFAVAVGFFSKADLANQSFYRAVTLISGMVLTPLIIGIVGVKTNQASWLTSCLCYLITIGIFQWLEWIVFDYFLIVLLLSLLAYFLTHIYLNGGIVTLKRSKETIAEQLWIPTWRGAFAYIKSWLVAPFRLHTLANNKIVNNPTHSLSFSMLIFFLYTFSSVMTGGNNDVGLANFMAGIHLVGITLCVGLMLEGIWPDRLKPYFALYWFLTLFYCLSFGSTLTFLRAHGDTMAVGKWIVNFIFLLALVDSMTFITLSCLGSGLAMVSWYVVLKSIPSDLLGSIGLLGGYLLFSLLVTVILFERTKERDLKEKFYLKSTFSHAMTHESTQPLSEIDALSMIHKSTMGDLSPMQNGQGEKGFWIPEGKKGMLEQGSQQIGKAVQEIKSEFSRFNKLIENEISTLERKQVSMKSFIESIVPTLPRRHTEPVKVKVECTKDFEAILIRPLFGNVFANFLKNAYLHGNASEMLIHIDGAKRKICVRDNGKGIQAETLPRIFDLHFTTGGQASSGVGLALVKIIVQASGGKISCHARHGDKDSFTEFVMEFPEV